MKEKGHSRLKKEYEKDKTGECAVCPLRGVVQVCVKGCRGRSRRVGQSLIVKAPKDLCHSHLVFLLETKVRKTDAESSLPA